MRFLNLLPRKFRKYAVLILALVSLAIPTGLGFSKSQISNGYKVIKVVDGDTFEVSFSGKKDKVRLIGVDTPEVVDPRKPVQCYGREASAKAKSVLTGQEVILKSDPTQSDRDRYNRMLRYVYLKDGTFFNKLMIQEGYAHEYTYNIPYQYQLEFKESEKKARTEKRGLWADNVCN